MQKITPVILSGGTGTRLWPVSTPAHPKQFISLLSDQTMFAQTLNRVSDRSRFNSPIVIASERHSSLLEAEKFDGEIIYEPCQRGTAPAIGLAALQAGTDSLLLILSSDHNIEAIDRFIEGIEAAAVAADKGWLVCLGIEPTHPETGYGYIEVNDNEITKNVRSIKRFIEKPSLATAQNFLLDGNFLWNAGIFLFRAEHFLHALKCHAQQMFNQVQNSWINGSRFSNVFRPHAEAFEMIESGAIDTVVMEKASNVACAPVDMGWSDVGSWDAIYKLSSKTNAGNVIDGNVVAHACHNTLVRTETIPIAIHGVSDLIVIASERGILVLPRGQSQYVKVLQDELEEKI